MLLSDSEFISYISKAFKENGLGQYLTRDGAQKFLTLTKFMLEENEKFNLTAIKDEKKIIINHYVDCVMLAKHLKKGSVIDVGCGGGFPTLPMAIVNPDLKILGIDSTAKRVNYVNECIELLGLENARAVAIRAEDGARMAEYRESFDFATARAVAEMRILCELCLPYVKTGGKMVAMKGKNAEFELRDAKKAISMLGGRNASVKEVRIIGENEDFSHPLIEIAKIAKTPAVYPRPYAKISKNPL